MRWFWIDRFEAFARGHHAVAIKAVSLAEEHLRNHFPGAPLVPNSLVLEGLAQTAGLLLADTIDYTRHVVLAKVPDVVFFFDARPGDVLRFHATVESTTTDGARVAATSTIDGRLQSEASLMFGYVAIDDSRPSPFTEAELIAWLDAVGMPGAAIASGDSHTRLARMTERADAARASGDRLSVP